MHSVLCAQHLPMKRVGIPYGTTGCGEGKEEKKTHKIMRSNRGEERGNYLVCRMASLCVHYVMGALQHVGKTSLQTCRHNYQGVPSVCVPRSFALSFHSSLLPKDWSLFAPFWHSFLQLALLRSYNSH